ncbi:MAG: hypothetical protein Q8Q33_05860 [Chlamydiota bacterium]|nr:hypothetical protein [Chlamydiota bacterium]
MNKYVILVYCLRDPFSYVIARLDRAIHIRSSGFPLKACGNDNVHSTTDKNNEIPRGISSHEVVLAEGECAGMTESKWRSFVALRTE